MLGLRGADTFAIQEAHVLIAVEATAAVVSANMQIELLPQAVQSARRWIIAECKATSFVSWTSLTYNDQRCPATKSVVIVVASGSALAGSPLALAAFFGLAAAFFFGGMLDLPRRALRAFRCS